MEQVPQSEQFSHPVFRTIECPEYSSAVFKIPFFKNGDVPYSFRQGHSPFTDRKQPRQLANDVVESLEVVTPGISTPVRRLSGGNVQKVLVGREIASAPTVLLTAYAVRGLDINSSYTIYDLLNQQKKKGVAVIFVGEDLDVLLELSDRILVLCGGQVSGIVDARTTDKNTVGMMMTKVGGEKNHEGEE